MKKIIIMSLLTLSLFSLFSDSKLIRRKITIFPFINQNNVKEYDYLTDTIRDAFRAKLQDTDSFHFTNFSDIDNNVNKIKNKDILKDENRLSEIAFNLNADVVVMGNFVIIEDKIMIMANSIDVLQKSSVTSEMINGATGVAMFDLISKISVQMAVKMEKEFPKVDEVILNQLIARKAKELGHEQKKEEIKSDTKKEVIGKKPDELIMKYSKRRKGLLGGGIAFVSIGGVSILFLGVIPIAAASALNSLYYYTTTTEDNLIDGLNIFGIAFLAIGITCELACIPFFVVARYVKKKKIEPRKKEISLMPLIGTDFKDIRIGLALKM